MPKVQAGGKEFMVDEEGFLLDPNDFDEKWMGHVQVEEGIEEMTHDHRIVIEELRRYYGEHNTIPTARELSRKTGLKIKYMLSLFKNGPGAGACKMAGLAPEHGLKYGKLPRYDIDRITAKQRHRRK